VWGENRKLTSLKDSVQACAKQVAYKGLFAEKEWGEWADAYIRQVEEHMKKNIGINEEWSGRIGWKEATREMLRFLRGEVKTK
jgi:hypothetical protein